MYSVLSINGTPDKEKSCLNRSLSVPPYSETINFNKNISDSALDKRNHRNGSIQGET